MEYLVVDTRKKAWLVAGGRLYTIEKKEDSTVDTHNWLWLLDSLLLLAVGYSLFVLFLFYCVV